MNILIVEDDIDLGFGLRNNLEIEGYTAALVPDGAAALTTLADHRFDLVILDLMLPGLDGFRVLRAMRDGGDLTPVLILTARGQEEDKVRGLKLGADDYVTKPFGVLELLARIEALFRRSRPARPAEHPAQIGDLRIDPTTREVSRAGRPVLLSPKEFDLLWALIAADGAVRTRRELMQEVWGYHATVLSRTVDTHIAELRRKLERDPAAPSHLLTVRKVGYRMRR